MLRALLHSSFFIDLYSWMSQTVIWRIKQPCQLYNVSVLSEFWFQTAVVSCLHEISLAIFLRLICDWIWLEVPSEAASERLNGYWNSPSRCVLDRFLTYWSIWKVGSMKQWLFVLHEWQDPSKILFIDSCTGILLLYLVWYERKCLSQWPHGHILTLYSNSSRVMRGSQSRKDLLSRYML